MDRLWLRRLVLVDERDREEEASSSGSRAAPSGMRSSATRYDMEFDEVLVVEGAGMSATASGVRSSCGAVESFVVQGSNSDVVKRAFFLHCRESAMQLADAQEVWYSVQCIYSWGFEGDGNDTSPCNLLQHLFSFGGPDEAKDMEERLVAVLDRSATRRGAVQLTLYRRTTDGTPDACCSVTMLPEWKECNKVFREQIVDFYGGRASQGSPWSRWLLSAERRLRVETLVRMDADGVDDILQWCALGSTASVNCSGCFPLSCKTWWYEVEGRRVSVFCVPKKERSGSRLGSSTAMTLTALKESAPDSAARHGGSSREEVELEVTTLRREVLELQATKASIREEIEVLLRELDCAREAVRHQECSLLTSARSTRHLLVSAHSSACAEHRSILSQVADCVDAYVQEGKEVNLCASCGSPISRPLPAT